MSIKDILTKTEYKVLVHIADGKDSKQIAEALNISPFTVKNHRYRIIKKLQLEPRNNTLVKWAIEHKEQLV